MIWSDGSTEFYGVLQAVGANVEISGKNNLTYDGSVDLGGVGKILLDPQTLDINAAGAGTNRTVAADIDQFNDFTAETSYITPTQLLTLLSAANVTLQANTDITFSSSLNASAAAYLNKSLTVNAGRSITITANTAITLNGGGFTATINDVGANAGQRTAGDALFSMNDGSSLTTNGGAINVTAGSFGGSAKGEIVIGAGTTMATMSSGSGNITLTGVAPSTTNVSGVKINVGTIQAGNGNIQITGTGVAGTSNAYGVVERGVSQINSTGSGTISIAGTGGDGTGTNHGIYLTSGAMIQSSGTGTVTLNGTGGNGTGTFNNGVDMDTAGSKISSVTGDILMNGTARGNNQLEDGILINQGTQIVSSGSAKITLNGTSSATATGSNKLGVWLNGLGIANSFISTVNGDISINGTGTSNAAATVGNYGINLVNFGVTSSGSGKININGNGGLGTTTNYGVFMASGSVVQSAGTGTILLSGTGGVGTTTSNAGIRLDGAGSKITSVVGDITVSGTGNGTAAGSSDYGVLVISSGLIESTGSANILVSGTGSSAATSGNHGIFISVGKVQSSGTGTITLNGTGNGTTVSNHGIRIDTANGLVTSSSGNIVLNGTGNGATDSYGIQLYNGAEITSTGGATVTVNGTGSASGTTNDYGVTINGNGGVTTYISSTAGNISINGTGGGAGAGSFGFYMNSGGMVNSTGAAGISISGASLGVAVGINISTGANVLGGASDTGDITLMADSLGAADSITLSNLTTQTTGIVNLRPINNSTTIGVGTGSTGLFNLTGTDLATISAGTSGIVIGKTTGTGAVDIRATTWNDGVTILSPGSAGQAVTINGALTAGMNKKLVVASGGTLVNNVGAGAMVVSGTGKWYLYAPSAAGSGITLNGTTAIGTFNALNASYLYNGTYDTLAPGNIAQSGNRFIFATPATLTFAADNASKYYGTANPTFTAQYNSGLLGTDTLSKAFQGTLSEFSNANGVVSPIVLSLGSGVSDLNYNFNFINGTLTTIFDSTTSIGTYSARMNAINRQLPDTVPVSTPFTDKLVAAPKITSDDLQKQEGGHILVSDGRYSGKILVMDEMDDAAWKALNKSRENKAEANDILLKILDQKPSRE